MDPTSQKITDKLLLAVLTLRISICSMTKSGESPTQYQLLLRIKCSPSWKRNVYLAVLPSSVHRYMHTQRIGCVLPRKVRERVIDSFKMETPVSGSLNFNECSKNIYNPHVLYPENCCVPILNLITCASIEARHKFRFAPFFFFFF